MNQVVNINNISDIEYTALMELLHDIYAKDLPQIDISTTIDPIEAKGLMTFFANQYAYITELWARMAYEVRLLKRTSQNKEAIDLAIDKRDYLEKVMSAIKIKYYASRTLVTHRPSEV